MTLADFTKPGLIVPHLRGRDAASAIHELSLVLHREGAVPDLLQFYNAAMNREFLLDTGVEPGIACPHARLAGITDVVFAVGRAREPFAWGPRPAQPVGLVFLLAVPAGESDLFLSLMSGLARLSRDRALVDSIHVALDAGAIFATFDRLHVRAPLPAQTS